MAEQKEEMLLTMLEQAGAALRRMKAEIRQMCSENEYVKGSTIIELCDKIENKQREFARLDDTLTELENAF
jgi:hypothetical protein